MEVPEIFKAKVLAKIQSLKEITITEVVKESPVPLSWMETEFKHPIEIKGCGFYANGKIDFVMKFDYLDFLV